MREIRTWVRKVTGLRVATSSPDEYDVFPVHARTGVRPIRRAEFANGYRLPVGEA